MLTVDLAAVRGNYRALAARAAAPLLPMVKANAYGMGAEAVARTVAPERPVAFGVATIAEGAALRAAGMLDPIIAFTPSLIADFPQARAAGMTLVLDAPAAIREWTLLGGAWHLQIDTGMSRAGVRWDDAALIAECLGAGGPPAGVFTHLHSAESDAAASAAQVARFAEVVRALPARPALVHVANTAGILRYGAGWDCARPGVGLYGVNPGDFAWAPLPVVSLTAPIVALRTVRPGDTVSYGATWTAARASRIATVAAGYADGYPRGVIGAVASIRGQRAPIVGVVTMDMLMCDVTDLDCELSDEVTLLGDGITVADVAAWASRSPYEILTGLNARAARGVMH
jgi:alanine racemase